MVQTNFNLMIYIFYFFDRLVGDNIDHETCARIQSKEHTNCSIHWTHQYASLDRVQDPNLEKHASQKDVDDVQLIELLPDQDAQANFLQNWAILAGRIITKSLPSLKCVNDVVICHIPHKYSDEMSKKSDTVSMFMPYDVYG